MDNQQLIVDQPDCWSLEDFEMNFKYFFPMNFLFFHLNQTVTLPEANEAKNNLLF